VLSFKLHINILAKSVASVSITVTPNVKCKDLDKAPSDTPEMVKRKTLNPNDKFHHSALAVSQIYPSPMATPWVKI
jgi:hypothetical protein